MELFMLIILLGILAEVSYLAVKLTGKSFKTGKQRRKVYIDTSALMDPRLLAVAGSGFMGDDMIVTRSVTNELQLLADGKDSEKRLRARAGLEAVRELERVVYFDMTILDDELDHTPVDNRLIELAKKTRGLILTNDYNLQKVAETEHIDVLNLNELALTLRGEYLPGEKAKIKIVAAGSNPHQGVGYLRDGTMVVVDKASNRQGKEVEVQFVKINQTASGMMMFARLVSGSPKANLRNSNSSSSSLRQRTPRRHS